MADVLKVSLRPTNGTRRARKERAAGQIPAILYGHGKENVSLSLPVEEIEAAIRHGSHVVQLQGAVADNALIKEVQWNAYGTDVLHVDLSRVEIGESVEVTVAVELRGEAPGTKVGGVIQHQLHEVEIMCPVTSIPEKFEVNINSLELGQAMTAADLVLPNGASLMIPSETLVVQCVEAQVEEEEEEVVPAGTAEPEVIGRKAEEEEGESDR